VNGNPSATIARAIQVVARTAVEWRLLMETLSAEVDKLNKYKVDPPPNKWGVDAEEWVNCGCAIAFPVRKRAAGRGKPRRHGYLNIILDLYQQGCPSDTLGQAMVQAGWSSWEDPWEYNSLTLPVLDDDIGLAEERLFVWDLASLDGTALSWQDTAWLYLVPLHALGRREDLKRLIIDPVFALVEGRNVEAAFRLQPEVLRFAERNGRITPLT
jgi:hypothetical protein